MNNRIVIALGGNALGNNPIEQLKLVQDTASTIADLVEDGYEVVIGHGNGPQVGMIKNAFDYSNETLMPFSECGAMSQGYIGYHLQQALRNELNNRHINKKVVTIISQVEVDENDGAFLNPSKPIGAFYNKSEMEVIQKENGYSFIEDAGRGYRRVVASPKPINIIELDIVKELLNNDTIVITVGGGGIPVIKKNNKYVGIDAVIDKDKACSKLAQEIKADKLIILTAIDKVYINFNKENQKALDKISINETKRLIDEGHFAKGSMLPKVEACIEYIEKLPNSKAIIASLDKAKEALNGLSGTIIYN